MASEATLPSGARILLDTCVYLDVAANRLPESLERLLAGRVQHHSSVCITELTYALGALDPEDARTPRRRRAIEAIVTGIVAHRRTVVPDEHAWASAGVLAGILRRTQGYGREHRRKALSDCLLLASALRNGFVLVSANLAEFDLLHQMLPEARLALYRPAREPARLASPDETR